MDQRLEVDRVGREQRFIAAGRLIHPSLTMQGECLLEPYRNNPIAIEQSSIQPTHAE